MLIAATSGRALAQAAAGSGYAPLVADAFGDLDTREMAVATERTAFHFEEEELIVALRRLADGRSPVGLVYGAGFEDRPQLLAATTRHWPLLGNSALAVARIKDPFHFASLCEDLGIRHPEVATNPCPGWLRKRIGGAGGGHVGGPAEPTAGEFYFQQRVEGHSLSALFLADGSSAQVVGFSRQWTSPTPSQPYRYGGAVRLSGLPDTRERDMTAAIGSLVARCGFRGLNSADFIVAGDGAQDWWLIEINPRPGATLDIFASDDLFSAHLAACEGRLPSQPFRFEGAAAAAVVYTGRDIAALSPFAWPDWTSDRQQSGSTLAAGDPLCTVRALAPSAAAARRLIGKREAWIKARAGAAS